MGVIEDSFEETKEWGMTKECVGACIVSQSYIVLIERILIKR